MKVFSTTLILALILSTPFSQAANPGDVVINEVCWMGSDAPVLGSQDEWLELLNTTGQDVLLDGWQLVIDGTPILISAANCPDSECRISAGDFFVIEAHEDSISNQTAGLVTALDLDDAGVALELLDDSSNTIDLTSTAVMDGGWYAGNSLDGYRTSMERRDPAAGGDLASNWSANINPPATVALASDGTTPIAGTPGQANSVLTGTVIDPEITHIHCNSSTEITVWFNSELDPTSAADVTNYELRLASGGPWSNPTTATLVAGDSTAVQLSGISGFTDTDILALEVDGLLSSSGGSADRSEENYYAGILTIAFARSDLDADFMPDLDPAIFLTVAGVVSSNGEFSPLEATIQDNDPVEPRGISLYGIPEVISSALRHAEVQASGRMGHFEGIDRLENVRTEMVDPAAGVSAETVSLSQYLADTEAYESKLLRVNTIEVTLGTWPAIDQAADLTITDDAGTSQTTLRIDPDTDIDGSPEPSWPADVIVIAGQSSLQNPPDDGYLLMPRELADVGLCSPEGSQRDCYTGPPATLDIGPCVAGSQTCTGGLWGACEGEVTPLPDDQCDGADDNCNDVPDDEADLTLPSQCGDCSTDCTAIPNTINQTCDTSQPPAVCAFECAHTHADCTADPGCETPLETLTDCTGCGDACGVNSACTDSTIGCECTGAFENCDGDQGAGFILGCEAEIGTDSHCSACGDDCTQRENASRSTCQAGTCQLVCDDDFFDCDADGLSCEDILTSNTNCGACDVLCTNPLSCINIADVWQCSQDCEDQDQDGHADQACGGDDCDDSDQLVYPGAPELCDGVDNDCDLDHAIDEDFPLKGQACDGLDSDECANGTYTCTADTQGVECVNETIQNIPEACDGQDNDCDGDVDEDWTNLGETCDSAQDEDSCANGVLVCNQSGNGSVCEEDPLTNQTEECNAIDDDCDGETDEGFQPITCGVGECKVTVDLCIDGQEQACVPTRKPEEFEVSCNDGLDNDCDDDIDEDDPNCQDSNGSSCGCAASSGAPTGLTGLLTLGFLLISRRRRHPSKSSR